MFKKKRRLNAREVREVLKRGRSMRVGPYQAKFLSSETPLKVAVIVPKKGAPKATTRTTLKRRAFLALETLPLPAEGALAVFVRP
jgi:RNase P protein component